MSSRQNESRHLMTLRITDVHGVKHVIGKDAASVSSQKPLTRICLPVERGERRNRKTAGKAPDFQGASASFHRINYFGESKVAMATRRLWIATCSLGTFK